MGMFCCCAVVEGEVGQDALQRAVVHRRHGAQVVGAEETGTTIAQSHDVTRLMVFDVRMPDELFELHAVDVDASQVGGVECQAGCDMG